MSRRHVSKNNSSAARSYYFAPEPLRFSWESEAREGNNLFARAGAASLEGGQRGIPLPRNWVKEEEEIEEEFPIDLR